MSLPIWTVPSPGARLPGVLGGAEIDRGQAERARRAQHDVRIGGAVGRDHHQQQPGRRGQLRDPRAAGRRPARTAG
ncbi:hypothetical protein [Spirillospora sp. NBC_01491]|uniref:hypothetical protein n=1 Tax=Spirillospora sp. NBC_01491 TaxID=2976007 RepID=UPI002E2EC96F|nr:hypothetical protein [Spirillospora sp. NBC_01491]